MDLFNWYVRQRVQAVAHMRAAFNNAEQGDLNIVVDGFAGTGFLMDAVVVTEDSPQGQTVLVDAALGWDKDGRRVSKSTNDEVFDFTGDDDPTNPRIASLYLKFARATSGPVTDGTGAIVLFNNDESYVLERDLGTPAASPSPPAARADESILLANITIPAAGGNIVDAGIDTTVQNLQSSFPFSRIEGSSGDLEGAILGAGSAGASAADRLALVSDVINLGVAKGYMGERKLLTDRTTPTTSLEIEICRCVDKTNSVMISLDNVVIDATVNGAVNRLDAGSLAADTWYYIYAISDDAGTLQGGLLSLNPDSPFGSAPTLPTGYTKSRRIGSVRTDGSANFINFRQIDAQVRYEEWQQALVSSGVPPTSPTSTSLATRVPPTAERAWIHAYVSFSASAGGEGLRFYDGGRESGTNPPSSSLALIANRLRFVGGVNAFSNAELSVHVGGAQEIYIESSGANVNGHNLYVRGYVDDSKEG